MVGVVPSSRYLLPLMPLLLLAWLNLARYANGRLGRRYGTLAALLILGLLLPGMVRAWGTVWVEQMASPFVARYHHGNFQPLADMAELIGQKTPPGAVIVYEDSNAGILSYLTRRQVVDSWTRVEPALAPRPVFAIVEDAALLPRAMLATHGLRPVTESWVTPDHHERDQVLLTLCSTPWRNRVLIPATSPVTRPSP
jgi:hypothetical protein